MAKHQNETAGYESQKDTAHYEEVWTGSYSAKKESLSGWPQKNHGAPHLSQQAETCVQTKPTVYGLLYGYHIFTIPSGICVSVRYKRHCQWRSGGMECLFAYGHAVGNGNNAEHAD